MQSQETKITSSDSKVNVFFQKTQDRVDFSQAILLKFLPEFVGKSVLIKPNIVSYELYPTTTHPETLKVVIEIKPTS